MEASSAPVAPAAGLDGQLVQRHRLSTRIWHWTNVVALLVMLMSGLMVFNAHPRLYWGQYGANYDKAWLQVGTTATSGFLEVGGHKLDTTGWLGRWKDADGQVQARAFPYWITIPSRYNLAAARRWHLAFAWLFGLATLLYLLKSLFDGHARRDLAPTRAELAPRHILHDIKEHALLRFPTGEAALRYNILQKLSYVTILFIVLPLLILTGLTMSPAMDAAWPWLLDLFGGRQSARSIHFICAVAVVLFLLVHLLMVLLAGPFNEIRSMITGRFRVPRQREERR